MQFFTLIALTSDLKVHLHADTPILQQRSHPMLIYLKAIEYIPSDVAILLIFSESD